mmetsp:Transcript_68552/g.189737  ORF Transcript_68552/g.189737 Transcript_68552/m.189737 type:complete len:328 (-) Transcript_68552:382-1365(-)
MELYLFGSVGKLVPVAAVRAVSVQDRSPSPQVVLVPLQQEFFELLSSLWVRLRHQPRRYSPDIEEAEVFFLNVLLATPVQPHSERLHLPVEAARLALLCELRVGELPLPPPIHLSPHGRGGLGAERVVRPVLEVCQQMRTLGVQLLDRRAAASIEVQGPPERADIALPVQLPTDLEQLSARHGHRAVRVQHTPPGVVGRADAVVEECPEVLQHDSPQLPGCCPPHGLAGGPSPCLLLLPVPARLCLQPLQLPGGEGPLFVHVQSLEEHPLTAQVPAALREAKLPLRQYQLLPRAHRLFEALPRRPGGVHGAGGPRRERLRRLLHLAD